MTPSTTPAIAGSCSRSGIAAPCLSPENVTPLLPLDLKVLPLGLTLALPLIGP